MAPTFISIVFGSPLKAKFQVVDNPTFILIKRGNNKWNPFGRRSSKLPGSLDEVDDYSLKEQSKTITDVETKTEKLSKAIKKSNEARENLAKATERLFVELAETSACRFDTDLSALVDIGHGMVGPGLKESAEHTNKAINDYVRPTLKAYRKNLQSLQLAVKKHENLVTEMHQLQSKVKKCETKDMSNANAHKLDIAKRDLDTIRQEHIRSLSALQKELPSFIAYRTNVIDPCLQYLAMSENDFLNNNERTLEECFRQLASRTSSLGGLSSSGLIETDDSDQSYTAEERSLLDEIKSLSIVIED